MDQMLTRMYSRVKIAPSILGARLSRSLLCLFISLYKLSFNDICKPIFTAADKALPAFLDDFFSLCKWRQIMWRPHIVSHGDDHLSASPDCKPVLERQITAVTDIAGAFNDTLMQIICELWPRHSYCAESLLKISIFLHVLVDFLCRFRGFCCRFCSVLNVNDDQLPKMKGRSPMLHWHVSGCVGLI